MHDAAIWAKAEAIVTCTDETHFSPDAPMTREELATILSRRNHKNEDKTEKDILCSFSDSSTISPWARDALAWAVKTHLLEDREDKTLAPKDSLTRAECAKILTSL